MGYSKKLATLSGTGSIIQVFCSGFDEVLLLLVNIPPIPSAPCYLTCACSSPPDNMLQHLHAYSHIFFTLIHICQSVIFYLNIPYGLYKMEYIFINQKQIKQSLLNRFSFQCLTIH